MLCPPVFELGFGLSQYPDILFTLIWPPNNIVRLEYLIYRVNWCDDPDVIWHVVISIVWVWLLTCGLWLIEFRNDLRGMRSLCLSTSPLLCITGHHILLLSSLQLHCVSCRRFLLLTPHGIWTWVLYFSPTDLLVGLALYTMMWFCVWHTVRFLLSQLFFW